MNETAVNRQKQRLQYIDLCAYVLGVINRDMMMERFEIKKVWATNDLKTYREQAEHNLVYDHALRAYKATNWFSPLFEHAPEDAISLICHGEQVVKCSRNITNRPITYSIMASTPNLQAVSALLKATNLSHKCKISYFSRSSGKTERVVAPHSLIKTGSFVYVRAFDQHSDEFRSFKLNRVLDSSFLPEKHEPYQTIENDISWNTEVELDIRVNSGVENQETIEFDYGLEEGKLILRVKEALIMYFLNDWGIAPKGYPELPPELFPLKVLSQKALVK